MNQQTPDVLKRLLLIRAGAVGDCLLLLPVLQSLRHHYPEAHIALMGYPSRLRLLQAYADTVISVETDGMETFFVPDACLPSALSYYFAQFDLILSYRVDPEGVFTQNLRRTGAKIVFPYPPFPPATEQLHIIDHYLKPLEMLQIPIISRTPELPLSAAQIQQAANFFAQHPLLNQASLVVAMHPGSGGPHKRWPAAHFANLADRLVLHRGATILCVPGPADQEVMQEVRARMKTDRIVIAEGLTLEEVAGLFSRVTLYIGNDSGLTHLAAAIGIPTVAIMGRTDPQRWAPRGQAVRILALPPKATVSQPLWDYFPVEWLETVVTTFLSERGIRC